MENRLLGDISVDAETVSELVINALLLSVTKDDVETVGI